MINIEELEKRIEAIEKRNAKVELDKAWETSFVRRFMIAILTYFVVVIYLVFVNNNSPFINAIVPAVGFFVSTLVIRGAKSYWENKRRREPK